MDYEVNNTLLLHGIEWRHSKTVIGSKSRDPEYDLKKRIEELFFVMPYPNRALVAYLDGVF